jgi:hypothetical protein
LDIHILRQHAPFFSPTELPPNEASRKKKERHLIDMRHIHNTSARMPAS